jgi:hypothetical protein
MNVLRAIVWYTVQIVKAVRARSTAVCPGRWVDHCFLSELWTPTSDVGRQLLPSHAEIETAKNNTQAYFALLGIPAARK